MDRKTIVSKIDNWRVRNPSSETNTYNTSPQSFYDWNIKIEKEVEASFSDIPVEPIINSQFGKIKVLVYK